MCVSNNFIRSTQESQTKQRNQVLYNWCVSQDEDLLPVYYPWLCGDKRSEESLNAALPAPEGGVVGLRHNWTLFPQKLVELLTPRDKLRFLREQSMAKDWVKKKSYCEGFLAQKQLDKRKLFNENPKHTNENT